MQIVIFALLFSLFRPHNLSLYVKAYLQVDVLVHLALGLFDFSEFQKTKTEKHGKEGFRILISRAKQ